MTTTSPASMGEPLSEADRTAEIQARLDAFHLHAGRPPWDEHVSRARDALERNAPADLAYLLGKVDALLAHNGVLVTEVRFQAERAEGFREERDAATARVGVLEGQLATARERIASERVAALIDPEAWRHIDPHSAEFFEELGARSEYEANFAEAVRQRRQPSLAAAERVIALFEDSRALGLDGGDSDA